MHFSIVDPVFNKEETNPLLYQAVLDAMQPLQKIWNINLVDHGSFQPHSLSSIYSKDLFLYSCIGFTFIHVIQHVFHPWFSINFDGIDC